MFIQARKLQLCVFLLKDNIIIEYLWATVISPKNCPASQPNKPTLKQTKKKSNTTTEILLINQECGLIKTEQQKEINNLHFYNVQQVLSVLYLETRKNEEKNLLSNHPKHFFSDTSFNYMYTTSFLNPTLHIYSYCRKKCCHIFTIYY